MAAQNGFTPVDIWINYNHSSTVSTVYIIPRNGTERNGIFRGIILRNGTPKVPRYIL